MKYETAKLGDFITFSNGRSSPDRTEKGDFIVFGSNGPIGRAKDFNAPPSTTVIGRVGTYCGSVYFAKQASWVTDNAIKAVANKEDEGRFWYYAMLLADLGRLRSGSGQPLINQRALNALELPVPPRILRLEIGDLLGSLDDKIELNRRMNETLEAMAQAIFRDWFVDFGPTRRKLEGATDPLTIMGGLVQDAERAQALSDMFPAALGNDGLPEGWNTGRLDEFTEVLMGASPKGDTYNEDGVGIPLANGPVEFGDYFLVEKKWTTSPTRLSKVGDFVICVRGSTTGRHVFADGVYCLGRGVAALRGSPGEQDFVNATIIVHLDTLLQKTTGSVFPNLSGDDIRSFSCLVPPKSARRQFSLLAEPLRMRIWHNILENRTLAATRDLLLPKLMSGEIRLSEAEGLMEAAQ